jgi:Zn-dependent protease/CBS domain-containing protein
MFTSRLQLFRLLGIPISVDASWLIILALVSWTFSSVFAQAVPGLAPWSYWALGAASAVVFFACIVLHELGHAVVARAAGMSIRGITLFMFGGVAELGGEPMSAGQEFLMAIAGPAVSALLAGLFWLGAMLVRMAGGLEWLATSLGYLGMVNATVLIFNLVPAFPLDGGRVLRSALWGAMGNLRRATRIASLCGQGFAWLLITLGLVRLFAGDLFGGIWLGLIGMFLNNAARMSYREILIRDALAGEKVRHFMNSHPILVPPSIDLRQWVEDFVYRYHHKTFPVGTDGHVDGIIGTRALGRYPRSEWNRHTVHEAMDDDLAGVTIPPDADALQALGKMRRTGSSRLLAMEGDQLVGIVSLKDLLRFLDLKIELEDPSEAATAGRSPPRQRNETAGV